MKTKFGIDIEILNFAGSVNISERDDMDLPLRVTIYDAEAFKSEIDSFF